MNHIGLVCIHKKHFGLAGDVDAALRDIAISSTERKALYKFTRESREKISVYIRICIDFVLFSQGVKIYTDISCRTRSIT